MHIAEVVAPCKAGIGSGTAAAREKKMEAGFLGVGNVGLPTTDKLAAKWRATVTPETRGQGGRALVR